MDLSVVEENGAYDVIRCCTIYTMTSTKGSILKYSVFEGWVSIVVEVAEKDGLASVGLKR